MASSTLLRDAAMPLLPTAVRGRSLGGSKLWPDTSLACLRRYERGTLLHEDWRGTESTPADAAASPECGWTRRWQRGPSDAPPGHRASYERLETRRLNSEEQWGSASGSRCTVEGAGKADPRASAHQSPADDAAASDPPGADQRCGSGGEAAPCAQALWAVWRCPSGKCSGVVMTEQLGGRHGADASVG